MLQLPERTSLVAQVADALRRGIETGEWVERLPGQRALAEQLMVSRPTLRAAMNLLRKRGYLRVSHGRRVEITWAPGRRRTRPRSNIVGFLSPLGLDNLTPLSLFLICDMQRRLADAGFKMEIHTEERFQQRRPARALEALVKQTRAACWLLHVATPEIQRWFSDRGVPALISKTCHPDIRLASYDTDHRAVGRHAAGMLLGLGHRRAAVLTSRNVHAGELLLEQGFRDGFGRAAGMALVAHHDTSPAGIRDALEAQFRAKHPPTGLLVGGAAATLTTLGHLAAARMRVPQDVSVICALDDPLLAYSVPTVARYHVDWVTYSRRLCRLILELATTGTLPPRPSRVIPVFRRGESLAAAPR